MIRGVTFILAVYSASITFYGGAEMVHDMLHYLADHFESSVHSHAHDHHHSYHDHNSHTHHHTALHNHQPDDAEDSLPVLIHFFLFVQRSAEFAFGDNSFISFHPHFSDTLFLMDLSPITPPPWQS